MLHGYFDASFTAGGGVSVLAGYIADIDTWAAIEEGWTKALDYWGIDDFHLCDLVRQFGHEKAGLMVLNFGRVLMDAPLHGFYVGINDADWDRAEKDEARHPTRYHKCADLLFNLLTMRMANFHEGERVALVMDRDISQTAAVEALHDEYKRTSSPFTGITFSNRRETVVLQCADLIAGLVRRDWEKFGFGETGAARDLLYALSTRANGTFWSLENQAFAEGRMFTASVALDGFVFFAEIENLPPQADQEPAQPR